MKAMVGTVNANRTCIHPVGYVANRYVGADGWEYPLGAIPNFGKVMKRLLESDNPPLTIIANALSVRDRPRERLGLRHRRPAGAMATVW